MTNVVAMTPEPKKLTFHEIITQDLSAAQVVDLWHDWFCKDESLERKGRALIARMRSIAKSVRFPQGSRVFFKNNCPLHGRTYDSFSITDAETGNILFWVAPKLGYDSSSGEAQVSWGTHKYPDSVTGSWADVKKFFLSTDAEWAAHLLTIPKPKFTEGVRVAVLGGYRDDEVKEDVVAKVGDEGRFTLAGMEHATFKANGEQVVHSYGRRSFRPRVHRCEVWQEHHDKLVAAETARTERNALSERIRTIRNKLSNFEYGTDEQVIARKSKIAALEAILAVEMGDTK